VLWRSFSATRSSPHNHLVVDTLTTVFPFSSEPFVRLREKFWLQVLTDAARTARSLTFTFAPETTVRLGFPPSTRPGRGAWGPGRGAWGRVCFVRLLVSQSEQERRIDNEDRKQFHKLTDLNTLRRLRHYRTGIEQPPLDLEINKEATATDESAALIADRFQLTPQQTMQRYPQPE
jgi:hypothetical protein